MKQRTVTRLETVREAINRLDEVANRHESKPRRAEINRLWRGIEAKEFSLLTPYCETFTT